jgi:hypothetical protein
MEASKPNPASKALLGEVEDILFHPVLAHPMLIYADRK